MAVTAVTPTAPARTNAISRRGGAGRRGVFFTIIALLVVGMILAVFRGGDVEQTLYQQDTAASRTRVSVMNTYVGTFERHAAQSLATAGYFALENLSMKVKTAGFHADMDTKMEECIKQPVASNCLNSTQAFDTSMQALIALAAQEFGIATTYTIEDVWLTEERPFEVIVWMNISYDITDATAAWHATHRTIRAPVSVIGIHDPVSVYGVANTNLTGSARVFNATKYRRYNLTNATFFNYTKEGGYIPNIGVNKDGKYYFAPSVLQRFNGSLLNGSACCGIETIYSGGTGTPLINATVNNPATTPATVNWSRVDWLFLSRNTIPAFDCNAKLVTTFNASTNPFKTVDPWFRLDVWHFEDTYQLHPYYNNSRIC
jgi:hypothetical protein